jgi:hypothetical protein
MFILDQRLQKQVLKTSNSKDLWLIAHKPISWQSEKYLAQEIPRKLWKAKSEHVIFIRLNHLRNTNV